MKKLVLAGFLLAGILGAKAQVITNTVILKSSTPQVSTTLGGGQSVIVGDGAGNAITNAANNNVFVGFLSGSANAAGTNNTFLGWGSGAANNSSDASYNTFLGRSAGGYNTTGGNNTFVGGIAGLNNTTGGGNVYVGFGAGGYNQTGGRNTISGWGSGPNSNSANPNSPIIINASNNSIFGCQAGSKLTGNNNVLIGDSAGFQAGGNNVMIGYSAGYSETGSNKLYIANSNTTSPLIWGDFAASQLKLNGKVGIGTTTFSTNPLYSTYKLFVTGGILSDEVRVALNSNGTWADYVFAKDYKLPTIKEVEKFIAKNNHLPNVPSAKQVKEEGINVGDMARIQQEKIEELMLYIIKQDKRIDALEAKLNNK